ncbi:MAG: hypothetical protein PUG91_08765 [Clostridiales bacterium]|nr:hypothetical protein [Clostridiales bacterium]
MSFHSNAAALDKSGVQRSLKCSPARNPNVPPGEKLPIPKPPSDQAKLWLQDAKPAKNAERGSRRSNHTGSEMPIRVNLSSDQRKKNRAKAQNARARKKAFQAAEDQFQRVLYLTNNMRQA